MKTTKARVLTSFLVSLFMGFAAQGKDAEGSSRWTLQQWLEQKNRMRMMDMWLMMNSPSPFEFRLGGNYISYTTPPQTADQISYEGQLSAFASIVGVSLEHENNSRGQTNETTGLLSFRVLGDSLQNSHLLLSAGQRTFRFEESLGPQEFRQNFGQAALQLYLTNHFGIAADHRSYLITSQTHFTDIGGQRNSGGLFIDFDLLRLSLTYFSETMRYTDTVPVAKETHRTGLKSGLFFYF